MAGALFGECQLPVFLAGAVPGEIWNEHRSESSRGARKVTSVARRVGFILGLWSDDSRIMVGTVLDQPRTVNDVSAFLSKFLPDFGVSFFVAGTIFGDVGGGLLLLRAVYITFHMR